MRLEGRTAVVTGAASGIGRGLALALARRGCHLALADIDADGLGETVRLLEPHLVNVSTHPLDVTDREAVAAFPEEVRSHHADVHVLINNAGMALGGTFEQVSEADFEWLMEVNFGGVVRLTRAFLPHLKQQREARVVNLSSVFGLISPPSQTAYAASKFAVRGFSNSLRYELADTSVGVTVVHPGGVATQIADRAKVPHGVDAVEAIAERDRFKKSLVMPPERAGETIVRGVEADKVRVLVGRDAHIIAALERLLPLSHMRMMRFLEPR